MTGTLAVLHPAEQQPRRRVEFSENADQSSAPLQYMLPDAGQSSARERSDSLAHAVEHGIGSASPLPSRAMPKQRRAAFVPVRERLRWPRKPPKM